MEYNIGIISPNLKLPMFYNLIKRKNIKVCDRLKFYGEKAYINYFIRKVFVDCL